MGKVNKANNDFDSFLNECNTYIWEWYIPERYVRFGIPSLNGSWVDDKEKIFKLETVLEKVHPDDVDKIFVRRNSSMYKSDKMFELDLRVNATGTFEWYGFRGRTQRRDKAGNPTYVRGVAINIENRVRIQRKLQKNRDYQLQNEKQKTDYCVGVLQEVVTFIRNLASNADSIITGVSTGTREERLFKIKELRDQSERILELIDKVKKFIVGNDPSDNNEIKHLSLWEHLAELQQIYSLKVHGAVKLYFSNIYDDLTIDVNVKLLDLLIENVINSQIHNTRSGYLTMNYTVRDETSLILTITCTENEMSRTNFDTILTESGLGLSVCKLLAKRLWGDITVSQTDENKMQYSIVLPLNANKAAGVQSIKLYVDDEIQELPGEAASTDAKAALSGLPHVLIGLPVDTELFENQHLFDVELANSTEDVLSKFKKYNPDIVFIDYNLKGLLSPAQLITTLHAHSDDTPIVVTADYAHRLLHKQLQQLGAKYLLNNPLSLRKVNVMIKKYLK